MPKKTLKKSTKTEEDVKDPSHDYQIDSNLMGDTDVKKKESISVHAWAKMKGDSSYPEEIRLSLVKPQMGKMTEGVPYYVNGRMVGYLVIQ